MTLTLNNIHKHFKDKHVLKGIGFCVQSGQALGYLGRNGAGKTTTIRILTDIFKADSGEILLDGQPIDYTRVRMGYLPEERGLYPKVKVGEQMIYIGRLRGMDTASAKKSAMGLLEQLGAADYWHKKLETLSKGNQQKIQLAIAVLHDPEIVILDEPFSGLDPVNAQILKDLILEQVNKGKIVLFSSHQMSYVEEFCAHICIINNGEIVLDGNISDIKKTYPRNRVQIVADRAADLINNEACKALAQDISIQGDQIEITLKNADDKQKLIHLLSASNLGMESFSTIQPTLHDIFVEYARVC